MSSRQIRKLQKQKDLEKAHAITAQDSDDSNENERPVATKPRVSLFAALGGDDDEDEAGDDDEAEPQPVKEEIIEEPKSASGKSKKKKKKKKSKAVAAEQDDEDEIDKALRELNLNTNANPDSAHAAAEVTAQVASVRRNELLSVNPHHLRAMNEMRSLFGRDIINSAEAEEEDHRRRQPTQQVLDLETFLRGPPGQLKLPEVSLRRNVFIQGREHWPRAGPGGLKMEEVSKAEDGSWTEYAYVHDDEYDCMQTVFFVIVQAGDPLRLVHLLAYIPYHVSTLLQVSSVAKQDQNMSLAAELCERALFSFGRITTSTFRQNMEQGRARLNFYRPENRQFWLAGYHYIQSLIRKGTYRTALEWAKLLYQMAPEDPYSMRYIIHEVAIRAHEARWLIDFINEVEAKNEHFDSVYTRQTLVLAKLQLGDEEGARQELEAGLKRLPWLYSTLCQQINLDTPASIWGANLDMFTRRFWTLLYLHRLKDLWNNAQAINLLKSVANGIDKVDHASMTTPDDLGDLGSTRLAYLSGQPPLLAGAPEEYLQSKPNYEFDPMPPPEEENVFSREDTRLPWVENPTYPPQVHHILADLLGRMQIHGPAPPPDDDDDIDDDGLGDEDRAAIAAAMAADEEEAREFGPAEDADDHDHDPHQHLHPPQTRADAVGQGLLARLLDVFARTRVDAVEAETEAQNEATDPAGLPGAWPSGEDESGPGGRRRSS